MAENAIVDLIEAIEVRMVALDYVEIEEEFDFDAVPSSKIHKAFRIEVEPDEIIYHSDNLSNPMEMISIWMAFWKKRVPRADQKTMLASYREDVETDLLNAAGISGLASDPLLTLKEATLSKEHENFLIMRLKFKADYLRYIGS